MKEFVLNDTIKKRRLFDVHTIQVIQTFFHTQIISKFDVKLQILVNRFKFINKNKNVMVNIPYPI